MPYSDYQIEVMDLRLMKCLDAVPDAPDATPSVLADCRYSAGLELLRDGVQRRDLPPRVTVCLRDHGVDAARVEDAKQCLNEALAGDLSDDVGQVGISAEQDPQDPLFWVSQARIREGGVPRHRHSCRLWICTSGKLVDLPLPFLS